MFKLVGKKIIYQFPSYIIFLIFMKCTLLHVRNVSKAYASAIREFFKDDFVLHCITPHNRLFWRQITVLTTDAARFCRETVGEDFFVCLNQ